MAGKRAKCPGCGSVVTVPQVEEDILDAEVIEPEVLPPISAGLGSLLDDELSYRVAEPDPTPTQSVESRRPCPACGEMIVAGAAVCRFCGEVFDSKLKKKSKSKRGSVGYDESDDNPSVGEWLIAIFCGLIGVIVAIVYIVQGKKKGWKMLAVPAGIFIISFIFGLISAMMEQP